MEKVKILGIPGSLREKSYNRSLIREAARLLPESAEMEIFELHGIPGFNEDEEHNPPEKVALLKRKIEQADAILFVTPEYNYSVSGVLKNAIDWASRPYGENSLNGKSTAVMGVTISEIGTARAQYHLRQMFVFLNMFPVNEPEVFVANAHEKFDEEGNLNDETAKDLMRELLQNLVEWTRRIAVKTPAGTH